MTPAHDIQPASGGGESQLVQSLEHLTKRRLATLYAMDRILTRAPTLEDALMGILEAVGSCEGWEAGSYWGVDEAHQLLKCLEYWHSSANLAPTFEALTRSTTFPPAVGLPGRVLSSRQAIWIPDVAEDKNFPRAEVAKQEGLHGGVGFPVWSRGRVVGVIEYFSPNVEPPDEDLMTHYESVGLQLGQFIERKQAELSLKAQNERLQRLDQLKDDLIFTISHELRTPLTSIMGYLEFMEDGIGGTLSPAHRNFVMQIRFSARRLESLVDDLLDFARLEAGTFMLDFETMDFAEKARDVIKSLIPQATEAGLSLESEIPNQPLIVTADPRRIEQVLLNLVGNAIKFTPPHGQIEVRARSVDGKVRCEVVDNGVGIQPFDFHKLFKRFSQLGGELKSRGTGLGLYISKHLIEAHHGEIGVKSVPGEGSTFWFTIPAGQPKDESSPAP